MEDIESIVSSIALELRRGTIIISVLSQLKEPQYGYSLVQRLDEKGVAVDPGTLYPLLRRLEKQGLLSSNWEVDAARPRRYYVLNETGYSVFARLSEEWGNLVSTMQSLLGY